MGGKARLRWITPETRFAQVSNGMPRQATRPVDKLRGPVRKAALQGLDRPALDDDPLITGLSELQTKQALKVLDTYCANVQRQGTGRIQNKAAYLMSLIQSYKLGPAPGSTGSAQRLMERLSQPVSEAVQAVFDPVVDRCVLEDRALMDLLAKVPEEQALAALKKYRATVQRRGRDAIENRCGYLIGFLKQYQDGVAVVGVPGNAVHQARTLSSNGEGQHLVNGQSTNGRNPNANGSSSRNGGTNTAAAGVSSASGTSSSHATAVNGGGGNPTRVRPITYLQAPVRKELETLFEAGKDKTVLEDVGLIKQLSRLGEEQALAALKNYKEASKHRRDIHNKSAYLMGILRGYIEGTNPISKAPWEGARNDDGSGVSSSTAPAPSPASGPGSNRTRGRGRGSGPVADDVERSAPNPLPKSNGTPSPPPPPPPPPLTQPQPQQPASIPVAPAPVAAAAPPLVAVPGPRELGGFTNAPAQTQQLPSPPPPPPPRPPAAAQPASPLTSISETPSTSSPLASPLLEGDRRFLGGIGHSSMRGDSAQHPYDPSNSLLYLNGGGANQQPLRHASLHESLFGGGRLSANHQGGRPQGLVGPGLLGGDFLSSGGGGEWGGVAPAHSTATRTGGPGSLFGSGLLAGDDVSASGNGTVEHTTAVPASPGSTSALGSTSGLGSGFLSGVGSGVESPVSSDAGNDAPGALTTSTATAASTGSLSVAGSSSCNGSTGWPPSSSPGSIEGRENDNSTNGNVNGVADVLARLNLVKYVPVLAEAEVDLDALRLFGEDDLKDLGFPKGPRIKLLHEVQNLSFPPRA